MVREVQGWWYILLQRERQVGKNCQLQYQQQWRELPILRQSWSVGLQQLNIWSRTWQIENLFDLASRAEGFVSEKQWWNFLRKISTTTVSSRRRFEPLLQFGLFRIFFRTGPRGRKCQGHKGCSHQFGWDWNFPTVVGRSIDQVLVSRRARKNHWVSRRESW